MLCDAQVTYTAEIKILCVYEDNYIYILSVILKIKFCLWTIHYLHYD